MRRFLSLCMALAVLFTGCTGQAEPEPEPAAPPPTVESPGDGETQSDPEPAPGQEAVSNDLAVDTPENHGVDRAVLGEMHTAVKAAVDEGVEIWSIVTVKDGAVIDEYYLPRFDETSPFYLASCTKSFMGALIGIAIDEGLIDGVDVKLSEYFPALADRDDGMEEITLEHLLTHTSGIAWDEWNGGTMFFDMRQTENWVDFVLEQPMAAAPGTVWSYNSGGSHLLSAVLEKAAGQTAAEYAAEHLFAPLGIDSVRWPADPQGITDGCSSIEMTARDAAKFGLLYLNGGKWRDRQVVPREWVAQSTSAQAAGTGGRTGEYGYQWWIRPFGEGNYGTFFAMGGGGHFIFVVPELELVVVMTCYNNGDSYAPWPYFTDYILPACA